MNLQEAIDFTFENKDDWIDGNGRTTARINTNHILRLLDPNTDVETINPKTFNALKKILKEEEWAKGKKRTNGGINRILSALSTVINFCHRMGEIDNKATFLRLKEKEHKAKFYTEEEWLSLMDAARQVEGGDGDLLYDSMLFCYCLGTRQAEMLGLTWETVDFENNTITFLDTKNGTDHTLPISKEIRPMLEERFHHRTCDRVFPWDGCRDGADALRRALRKAKKIAGMDPNEDRLWHSIRHTTGTHLCSKGVPLRTVMGVLNHSNINTTLRYAKNTDKAIADALELL